MSAALPLACDPTAIDPAQRTAHGALAEHLLADGAQEIQEFPDGFAARFTAEQYPLVSAFVENERRCCPFLNFRLDVQAGQGTCGSISPVPKVSRSCLPGKSQRAPEDASSSRSHRNER
jgi:hypothetical protein